MIESTAVSITAALLNELSKRKVKIIFCDEKRNPSSELVSYYGSYNTSDRIVEQFHWNTQIKQLVWTEIVKDKILKQAGVLLTHQLDEANTLLKYIDELEINDSSNREGHAAKVYFNALFGKDFSRGQDNATNACLNYGYSILLSIFNREIVLNGYLTQLGIFHRGKTNPFNFASDLMEPWRPLIDNYVYLKKPESLTPDIKYEIIECLSERVIITGKSYVIMDAIKIYCRGVFEALNEKDLKKMKVYRIGE